jgi:thiamine transport system substrate-binding protein
MNIAKFHIRSAHPSPHGHSGGSAGSRLRAAAVGSVILLAAVACAGTSPSKDAASHDASDNASTSASTSADGGAGSSAAAPAKPSAVTLITHDSFAVDPGVLAAFEKESGITVTVLAQGDAGEMLSKAIVTKSNPLGDAIFGIDNTFATKALEAGILAPYSSPLASKGSAQYAIDGENRLTPVDFGDVCVNVDHKYFTEHGLAEPSTFEDLAKPEYKNLLVTEDAATSSPGLAFLLGTIAHFGDDGWQQYWSSLVANGVKVDAGWTDAYTVDFSGSSGHGDRPLVVSYASSPPSEVPEGATEAPTGALLDTCFRQIEYTGVLAGAKNPLGAEKVVDFLLSEAFQAQIPGQMYMYPVDTSVTLPADWATFAPVATNPATIDPAEIDKHRQQWIDTFTDIVRG